MLFFCEFLSVGIRNYFFDEEKEKGIVKVFWLSNIKRGNYLNFSMIKVRVIFYSI